MKHLPFFLVAAIFLFSVFSGNASAVCICEGGVQSASCKACGTDSSSGTAAYTVKPGQQLSEIAGECGVDAETIKQANPLGDNAVLQGGQVLQVPGGHCGATSSPSATVNTPGIAWPTPCCAKWYSGWGTPRAVGGTHKGLDIGHPIGTPIFAPGNGVIAKVVLSDSGTCGLRAHVKLDSGVFIVNCHMNSVEVRAGQRVAKCQRIGTVGKTGNARITPPHDHFEIWPDGRTPQNPLPILQKNNEYCPG